MIYTLIYIISIFPKNPIVANIGPKDSKVQMDFQIAPMGGKSLFVRFFSGQKALEGQRDNGLQKC